ncbi:MAG: hypothetical protein ACREEB_05515, partial [Caulobacteraceae bacterium]
MSFVLDSRGFAAKPCLRLDFQRRCPSPGRACRCARPLPTGEVFYALTRFCSRAAARMAFCSFSK